jgi:2-keto-4-pentenoate hydratase
MEELEMLNKAECQETAKMFLEELDSLSNHRSLASSARSSTLPDGYAVQDAFHDLLIGRGHSISGWKVALTSAAMQEFCGVTHPLAGAVFDNDVHQAPARVDLSQHLHMGVECEIAVFVNRDLTLDIGPHTRESISKAVERCSPAFELIEDRNADYSNLNTFDLVSENAWNAGVVIGVGPAEWKAIDLKNGSTKLEVNGELVGEGKTGDALGHPLDAVAWLANHLNERDTHVKAGQFVMTGSSVITYFPNASDHLVFSVDGCELLTVECV